MAMVEFDHTVKYRGVFYAPHVSVEVEESEVEQFIKSGAKRLPQVQQEPQSPSGVESKVSDLKKPQKAPAPTKKG